MKQQLKKLYGQHELKFRFLIVGGFNTVLGIITFPLLYYLLPSLHRHYQLLLITSQIICITTSYFDNKYFVFKSQGSSFLEYLKFTAFYNLIFMVNLITLPFLVAHLTLNPAKIQIIINLFIAIGSYFWHKNITFIHSKFP